METKILLSSLGLLFSIIALVLCFWNRRLQLQARKLRMELYTTKREQSPTSVEVSPSKDIEEEEPHKLTEEEKAERLLKAIFGKDIDKWFHPEGRNYWQIYGVPESSIRTFYEYASKGGKKPSRVFWDDEGVTFLISTEIDESKPNTLYYRIEKEQLFHRSVEMTDGMTSSLEEMEADKKVVKSWEDKLAEFAWFDETMRKDFLEGIQDWYYADFEEEIEA